MNGSTRILLKPVECTYKVVFYRKILNLMPPFTGTGLAAAATPVLSHSAFLSEHQKPRFTRIKRSNTSTGAIYRRQYANRLENYGDVR